MSNKIIYSNSDKDTGVSVVTIQNKYGKFTGHAFCNKEDNETFSAYTGERYAEIRAIEQFAKFRLKQEKIKLKTIKNLLTDIKNSSKCQDELFFNESNPIYRKINLKLRDYSQSVDDWNNLCTFLATSVQRQDKERQKVLSRTKENN